MTKSKAADAVYKVVTGINFPRGQRRDPGDTVRGSELTAPAVAHLLRRGHIIPAEKETS